MIILNLDLIEIERDKTQLRLVANQQAAARSYNLRVKVWYFVSEDLVLKKVMQKQGVFSPNWDEPY